MFTPNTPYAINDAQRLAQESLEFAFSMPTAGSATDVPVGLVPYSMANLENIAVSMLTNGPGWFNGDSPIYDHDDTPSKETAAAAVAMVRDYFKRCTTC